MARAMMKMDHSWASIHLGERPRMNSRLVMPDNAAAQELADSFTNVRQKITEMTEQAAAGGGGPGGMEMAMLNMFMSLYQFKVDGSEVIWDVTTEQLVGLAQLAAPAFAAAQAQAKQTLAMNQMRQILLGIHQYAADHNTALPDNLAQIKEYVGGDEAYNQLMTHPTTGENPAFIYVKPTGDLSSRDLAKTVILYEARNGKKAPNGLRGFADAHVETVD